MTGIFLAALIVHFYFVTVNWTAGFMPGHEFRQAQTAIISYYIDKQNNFSLLYETPVVGKPWVSILMEVPLYEWSVVGLSRLTGWHQILAARTITLACFYLTLPAIFLLLGRFGLSRPRRLLALALILTCPVYLFYSRAFLMDSMEVMCSAWFLLGFVRTMDERRWFWLALAVGAGTAAALVKSVAFAVWLVPAAGYGVWLLWRDLRARTGWRAPLQTALWGAATVVVSLGALRWWIDYTDPIKAAHASAFIFTSKNLSEGNWGLVNLAARFSLENWKVLLDRWQDAIMAPWVVGLFLLGGVAFLPRVRWPVLGLASVFLIAQLMFPFAYAYQDYYFYTCTVFLLAAFAYVFYGLLDSRLPAWCCWLVIAVPFVAQLEDYWNYYRLVQAPVSNGGFTFTDTLRDLAPPNSVFIIAGDDWAPIIPLYSRHKALMIRNGLEYDRTYLRRAFKDLAGESVSVLVIRGPLRKDRNFIEFVTSWFDMADTPTLVHPVADMYVSRRYIGVFEKYFAAGNTYPQVKFVPGASSARPPSQEFEISEGLASSAFAVVTPAPFRGFFKFGFGYMEVDGNSVLSTHPDTDLWMRPPKGATRISWDFGIVPDAYERAGGKTEGVDFIVVGETPAGQNRQIFHRVLDPVKWPEDRGQQHETISFRPLPGEVLRFSTRPYKTYSFDWAYWTRIDVK